MADYNRIHDVKNAAKARLMMLGGVHAVGVGPKITGGKHTGELSIVVFVEKKKLLSELSPEQIIPTDINGVKTDVHEAGKPQLVSADESNRRPLRGGTQVRSGGGLGGPGTLACFARSDELDAVYALTCEHVVGMALLPVATDLSVSQTDLAFTFSGANTDGAIVVFDLTVTPSGGQSVRLDIIQRAAPGMTPAAVAQGINSKVQALTSPGFNVSLAGDQVTFSGTGTNSLSASCLVDGLHYLPDSGITVKIAEGAITLSGESNSNGAAYVAINVGGSLPTYGAFVPISKGDSSSEIADAIAQEITHRALAGVSATSGNSVVTVTGVEELECDISTDRQVGQATDCFCSKCCCCNDRIGTVYDARLDLDVALVKLDPDMKYRAEIWVDGTQANDWVVTGSHAVVDADLQSAPYNVKKRGRTTQVTKGTIAAVGADGVANALHYSNDAAFPHLFQRHYTEAILVQPSAVASDTAQGDFAWGGDSGSAVLNDANEVVGILFAGGKGSKIGVVSPIQPVLDAWTLIVQTADAWGQDQIVPDNQMQASAAAIPATSAKEVAPPFTNTIMQHLRAVESQVKATPAGREYLDIARQHADEAQRMVNTNPRVATVWRRNWGPQIMQAAFSATSSPNRTLPAEIQGEPLTECLRKIYEVYLRYSSPEFAADLRALAPRLFDLAGLTYGQAIAMLGAWEPKRVSREDYGG